MSITKVFGRRRKTLVSGGSGSEMEGRMSYVTRGLVTSAALLLLAGGIWATWVRHLFQKCGFLYHTSHAGNGLLA